MPRFSPILLIALACVMDAGVPTAMGQSAWYEGFESTEPTWNAMGGDARYEIRRHERTALIQRTGERSEYVSVMGDGGTYIHIGHEVGKPRIIQELAASIQIRADRPGIQLMAEVTLPRSRHPQTGQLLTTLVRGASYTAVGQWQQLRIDDFPRLLTRQTQVLRAEHEATVDPREAYVSRIVLNVYGGPGVTNVWIDDLDLSGYVETPPRPAASDPAVSDPPISVPGESASAGVAAPSETPGAWQGAHYANPGEDTQRRVQLDRSVLLVDGRQFFVRAVRWRGEPFTVLKALGFNTAWLDRFPSAGVLAEAERTSLWLICPPPPMPQSVAGSETPPAIGTEYRSVIAWDLGQGLDDRQTPSVRSWAKQLRTADSQFRRPLIARPESNLREYSRIADILVIGRPALGSSLELSDYAQWLRLRPNLARPGTPIWVVVPTDPEPALRAQWEAMSPGGAPVAGFSAEQLRLATYVSCVGGARGLLFESHRPMDSMDPSGEVRRTSLELLNLELTLVEPWFAGGDFSAMALCRTDPEIIAPVFRANRAQLVIPIWAGPGAGQVPGLASQRSVPIVVPGALEADDAHVLGPGRLQRSRTVRVAGGTQVTVDKFDLTAQVLLTQDPLAFTGCSRRAQQVGRRMAELQRKLVALKTEEFERLIVPLSLAVPNNPQLKSLEREVPTLRRTAGEALRRCDEALSQQDYASAYGDASEAMRPFRLLARQHWQAAYESVSGASASPLLATFATLPDHWTLLGNVSQSMPTANLLPGGDFENLQTWLASGWEHVQYDVPAVTAAADLVPEAARTGNFGLRLSISPTDPQKAPQLVESPPVWIASAPINLPARSLVVIRGWVRIAEPIQGAADGLLVFDSLTGRSLAERIHADGQWQEFILYRVCPQSGPLRVTFAMSGMGTAHIDDVTVQTLAPKSGPVASQPPYPVIPAR